MLLHTQAKIQFYDFSIPHSCLVIPILFYDFIPLVSYLTHNKLYEQSTGTFFAVSRYSSATHLPPSILSRGIGWQVWKEYYNKT